MMLLTFMCSESQRSISEVALQVGKAPLEEGIRCIPVSDGKQKQCPHREREEMRGRRQRRRIDMVLFELAKSFH